MNMPNFKYVRIQGKELARNTMQGKGIFSMCWKMIRPAMWLLDRYNHPYYLVFTNTPGEIVYEDQYQIAAKADHALQIEDVQPSWSPEE